MARSPIFGVESTHVGGAAVVRLRGELDRLTVPELRRALAEPRRSGLHVIVALSDVTYLDMSGIRLLEEEARAVQEQGRMFVVVEPPPVVRRILEIVGFDRTVPVQATVAEATRHLLVSGTEAPPAPPPDTATGEETFE